MVARPIRWSAAVYPKVGIFSECAVNARLTALEQPWSHAAKLATSVGLALLAEKLQHALRNLVGLTKHCGTSLLEDLVLGEVDHFLGHVGVTNA